MKDLRLDKFLTEMGKGSRSQVKTYISKGRVTVNGEIIKRPEYKISPENDIVNLEGEKVNYSQWEYYMLNKPAGCVSATEDKHFPTVVSFIEDAVRKDLFPVGRLDKESTGLLLLTNNGQLMDDVLRGSNYHEKEYIVHVNKPITDSVLQAMAQGVPILDTITRPCKIRRMGKDCLYITLTQGLNRQIRRMCEYFDYRVTSLKRIRIMNIELGSLPVGKWRELTPSEIKTLKNLAQNKGEAE